MLGLAVGCDSTSLDGTGGTGGTPIIGPLLWTTPGLTIVGDDCDPAFLVDQPLSFELTIQGSDVLLIDADPTANPATALQGSTDSYVPTADVVLLTGTRDDDQYEAEDGCVVRLNDAFRIELSDPSVSLDQNATVQVTWTHDEADVSTVRADACSDPVLVWFNGLPCASEATFTLTQDPAP
jgi:hypothetical protein